MRKETITSHTNPSNCFPFLSLLLTFKCMDPIDVQSLGGVCGMVPLDAPSGQGPSSEGCGSACSFFDIWPLGHLSMTPIPQFPPQGGRLPSHVLYLHIFRPLIASICDLRQTLPRCFDQNPFIAWDTPSLGPCFVLDCPLPPPSLNRLRVFCRFFLLPGAKRFPFPLSPFVAGLGSPSPSCPLSLLFRFRFIGMNHTYPYPLTSFHGVSCDLFLNFGLEQPFWISRTSKAMQPISTFKKTTSLHFVEF